jgi:hypothetical protein
MTIQTYVFTVKNGFVFRGFETLENHGVPMKKICIGLKPMKFVIRTYEKQNREIQVKTHDNQRFFWQIKISLDKTNLFVD